MSGVTVINEWLLLLLHSYAIVKLEIAGHMIQQLVYSESVAEDQQF